MTSTHDLRYAAPVYQDKFLAEMTERRIAAADEETLRAAVCWTAEDQLLRHTLRILQGHHDNALREFEHAERRAQHKPPSNDPSCTRTTELCAQAATRLQHQLALELHWAEEDVAGAEQIQRVLHQVHGAERVRRYQTFPRSTPEVRAMAGLLRDQMESSRRLAALLAEDRRMLHTLALEEEAALAFMTSPASISLQQINAMSYRQFERLTANLAARDGLRLVRSQGGPHDAGADVIAVTPDGKRVVVQCKHSKREAPVGVSAIQKLNGTARPVHGADIVIAITNSTFSKHALDFAQRQQILLLSWPALIRWATWGESLLHVLGREETRDLDA